ncbi:ATP-grasp domain-containing protein [Streptomyces sp. 8N616]|uniref:ATP-grasp domain-containing protein n=1 Tax=Streptomyces sp. 8N616 TaxID=3457414 RepID=UPI003FD109B3
MGSTRPLLVIGGASVPAGEECVHQAVKRGLDVWLVDSAANLERFPHIVGLAEKAITLDYNDVEACVAWAKEHGAGQEFLGVHGYREMAMESTAAVAEVLGLPGLDRETVRRLREKARCREALRERGFRQPRVALCRTAEDVRAFIATTLPGPWIVKPRSAQGGVGVSRVSGADEVDTALAHLRSSCAAFGGWLRNQGVPEIHSDPTVFLVEEFQDGQEYSAEGVCVDGVPHVLAVTEKLTSGPPHFAELGHALPAGLDADAENRVKETVTAALRAMGVDMGLFHVEFWYHQHEVVLGEVHVRPAGDRIPTMVEAITGVELHGAVFDQMLGRAVDPSAWPVQRGATMRYFTPAPGRITKIEGWDKAASDPRVLASKCDLKVGDQVQPVSSYLGRSTYLATTGPTRQAAVDALEELMASVVIETDPAATI